MTEFASALAKMSQAKPPRYSEAQLKQFVDSHERFARNLPGGCRAMLRYVQAQGCDFSGRILAGADLTGANLRETRLVSTSFAQACLHLADLRSADARDANFTGADARGASLRHANLTGAVLDGADLSHAVLARGEAPDGFRLVLRPNADIRDDDVVFAVDFTGCSMKRAGLANAKLNGANFSGALMTGIDLRGADLSGSKFDGAVLTGAAMAGAKIDRAALAKCVLDPSDVAVRRAGELSARLDAAERWIATNGAEGCPALLDGEDLRPLKDAFAKRRLTAISADRACAIGVSFAGAQLQGGKFDDADLRDADFTGADLRGASFRGAKLRHARFKDADMRPLPLANGAARTVDLTGADHSGDCFSSSQQS